MKKTKTLIKTIIIISISLILFSYINNTKTYAASMSISDIQSKASQFIDTGKQNPKISETSLIEEFIPVGQVLVFVANLVVILVSIIMGIKWITASPEQQGKLKEQLIGYVISIVVIYGGVGIWAFVRAVMKNF